MENAQVLGLASVDAARAADALPEVLWSPLLQAAEAQSVARAKGLDRRGGERAELGTL